MIKIATMLGLAATASEHEVEKAVDSILSAKKLIEQQRDDFATQLAAVNAKLAGYESVLAKQSEDRFIEEAVRAGKVIPSSQFEQALRAFHAKDAEGAKALVLAAPVVTPIGQPRQSGGPAPTDPKPNGLNAEIAGYGGEPDKVRAHLLAAGIDPDKALARISNRKGA